MERKDADFIARLIYREVITEAGYAHPFTYDEMLAIFLEAGADVVHCPNLPLAIPGMSIGEAVYVNTNEDVTDAQRMRFLAHEFAHFKRRGMSLMPKQIRFYRILGTRILRDDEEQIARAFMRLF